jgi:prophage antirepressor-like protein
MSIDHIVLSVETFNDLNINIYGTYEEPLFKTKDICDLLDILNDSEHLFLTEYGLYDLLCVSSNPITKEFKLWVRDIIKQIRSKALEQLKTQKLEYEEKLKEKELELNSYKEKKYEEIEKNCHLYVIKTDGGYKVGKTKDIKNRMKGLQTANVEDIQVILDFKTSNSELLERNIHYILSRYRCNSNREFFDCNLDYIKNVVTIMGHTIDTLKSSYQDISSDELIDQLNKKLKTKYESIQTSLTDEFKINKFINTYIERKPGSGINWVKFWMYYQKWYYDETGNLSIKKWVVKQYLENNVFKTKIMPVSKSVGRGWCGWRLKEDLFEM